MARGRRAGGEVGEDGAGKGPVRRGGGALRRAGELSAVSTEVTAAREAATR